MLLLSGPNLSGNELKYVTECIQTGWVSSVGAYVDRFEQMTAAFTGAKYAVATSSGTTALHTCLVLLGVQPNDLVIAPNITFVASINAIKYTGAAPILIDADEHSWQMDLNLLEEFLEADTEIREGGCYHRQSGRRIPVMMPVHVLGSMCDMDRLMALCRQYHIAVLEDSTEALGSTYKGKHAGTIGAMGTLSYNGNKIITTGGGGMILTDDEDLAKRAKHLTTQAKADAFEYYHDTTGYNYRLTNVAAAMGVAQMEQLPGFLKRKKEIISYYKTRLQSIGDIRFQQMNKYVQPNWWLPTILTEKQKQVLERLNAQKMQSRPFWVPMNRLPMHKSDIYYHQYDRSQYIYRRGLSIPCSTNIKDDELEAVCMKIAESFQ